MSRTVESKQDIRIIESEYKELKAFFVNNESFTAIFLHRLLEEHQKRKCIEIFSNLIEQNYLTGMMKELYDVKFLEGE